MWIQVSVPSKFLGRLEDAFILYYPDSHSLELAIDLQLFDDVLPRPS